MLNIRRIDSQRDDIGRAMADLRAKLSPRGDVVSPAGRQRTIEVFGRELTPLEVVARICNDVREQGLPAVLDYNRRIDKVSLDAATIRVPSEELAAAHAAARPEYLAAIRRIRDNIAEFQRALLLRDVRIDRPGGWLAQRYLPLQRVGVCVPGGAAAYPSSLLMTVVPAQVAGVPEIAVMAPPTRFGAYNPELLAACRELGVSEVYRMGGAQGVAALAYGVEGVPRVDKIVGPGNLFVALAKRLVFGEVAIDSIAGPSEVVVIVDHTTKAEYTAMDLLAQAEHAPGASILIGWDQRVLDAALEAVEAALDTLDRGQLARQSLEEFGAVILARDSDEACRLTDQIAPEHLHIATADAELLARRISHAGAIFLGNHCPVAVGDYAAGPSHVLPTSGTARFTAGLTANDFLRGNSLLCFTPDGLAHLAADVCLLAGVEGLTAHRASVETRLRGDH